MTKNFTSKMNKYICAVICCSLFSFSLGSPLHSYQNVSIPITGCGRSKVEIDSTYRIVGGKETTHGQYPWIVSLREKDKYGDFLHICGASILNENWILTAAHCFDFPGSPEKYQVLAGLHKLNGEDVLSVRKYKISQIIVHHGYDSKDLYNDIALMKTSTPMDMKGSDGYITGVCTPKSQKDPDGWATIVGWGFESEFGKASEVLKRAVVPLIDRQICKKTYKNKLLDSMICAGMKHRDACQLDSGGPLTQESKSGVSTLIGVISYGIECGGEYPAVYTKVSTYNDWLIEKTLK